MKTKIKTTWHEYELNNLEEIKNMIKETAWNKKETYIFLIKAKPNENKHKYELAILRNIKEPFNLIELLNKKIECLQEENEILREELKEVINENY